MTTPAELTLTRSEIQDRAREIAAEYGGNLTLRQLYYQFVARGLLASGQKVYNRVGSALAVARLEGRFPWDWLVDRTRTIRDGNFTRDDVSVEAGLGYAEGVIRHLPAYALGRARWFGQSTHVSVWVEKEALAGVFEGPCDDLGVSWFTCKGYPSLSALYQWCKSVEDAYRVNPFDECVVVYFGDHDPDGIEIPRAAERRINEIAEVDGINLPPIRFERVALTLDQIAEHNPPPFPVKLTSSRAQGYIDEFGIDDSWELDALDPRTLTALIEASVERHFDAEVWRRNRDLVEDRRRTMAAAMRADGWIENALS